MRAQYKFEHASVVALYVVNLLCEIYFNLKNQSHYLIYTPCIRYLLQTRFLSLFYYSFFLYIYSIYQYNADELYAQ